MVEQALDLARKRAIEAEAYCVENTSLDVIFEAGKLKTVEEKRLSGVSVRVILNGKFGVSSTTDPDRIGDMVESACASARLGKTASHGFPRMERVPSVDVFDPAVAAFSPDKAVEEGKKAVAALRELVPGGLTDAEISASTNTVHILNTAGFSASYTTTEFSHYFTSVIIEDDSILWISDGGHFGDLRIQTGEYVSSIGRLSGLAKTKAPKCSGTLPVIFTAQEMTSLVEALELGVNGKHLLKGDSPLKGRLGENVLGDVTITDDPLYSFAAASRPFDDEGVASGRTVLFDKGVFSSFIFDLDTGAQTGNESTGNASRSLSGMPGVDTSNIIIEPGDTPLDEMLSDIDEGIVVFGVLGGGQSNLLAGDFALNVMLGFHVRNGEITGRVTDTMVSGNVYDAFSQSPRLGSELKMVGSLVTPDVMFPALSVSAS